MELFNPSPQPAPKVDPELERIFRTHTIDFINELCKALPKFSGSLVSGVTVVVATDNQKVGMKIYIPPGQTSKIIPVAELPQGIKPINGFRH